MTPDEKAALILRALSGEHLHGFLPGEDHKTAVSHAVGTHHEWGGGGQHGRVTKRGIETFDSLDAMFAHTASQVIPWREVLDIVAKGCGDGRRERYEAAFAGWSEHHRRFEFRYWGADECKRRRNRTDEEIQTERDDFARVSAGIRETTRAIITAGCEREVLQPELF
jgi:hypothetical protein